MNAGRNVKRYLRRHPALKQGLVLWLLAGAGVGMGCGIRTAAAWAFVAAAALGGCALALSTVR